MGQAIGLIRPIVENLVEGLHGGEMTETDMEGLIVLKGAEVEIGEKEKGDQGVVIQGEGHQEEGATLGDEVIHAEEAILGNALEGSVDLVDLKIGTKEEKIGQKVVKMSDKNVVEVQARVSKKFLGVKVIQEVEVNHKIKAKANHEKKNQVQIT